MGDKHKVSREAMCELGGARWDRQTILAFFKFLRTAGSASRATPPAWMQRDSYKCLRWPQYAGGKSIVRGGAGSQSLARLSFDPNSASFGVIVDLAQRTCA
jgi:hypothetical protein